MEGERSLYAIKDQVGKSFLVVAIIFLLQQCILVVYNFNKISLKG